MLNKINVVIMTNLTEVNYDQINELIPRVETYIKHYCNIEELNPALELVGANIIEYLIKNSCKANISSESISDIGSVTYSKDFPDSMKAILNSYRNTKYSIGG